MIYAEPKFFKAHHAQSRETIPLKGIRNGYGLSEVVAGAVVPPPERTLEMQQKGSVGIPMPCIEV